MRRVLSIHRFLLAVSVLGGFGLCAIAPAQEDDSMPGAGAQRRLTSPIQMPYLAPPGGFVGPAIGYPAYPYYGGYYYGTPWYIPQTIPYKRSNLWTQPQWEFPKLGLHYNYPYAFQFGIQIPPETDEPIYLTPEGVPVQGGVAAGTGAGPSRLYSQAVSLLKNGRFVEAGRLLAKDLSDSAAPPEQYFLISVALVGAGKAEEAEIVLRQAIDVAKDLDFLDRADLAAMFPGPEVLKAKLAEISDPLKAYVLLRGTFKILAGQKKEGLDALRGSAKDDVAARRVFLHFVGGAFGGEEQKAPPPPAPEKKPEEKKA